MGLDWFKVGMNIILNDDWIWRMKFKFKEDNVVDWIVSLFIIYDINY